MGYETIFKCDRCGFVENPAKGSHMQTNIGWRYKEVHLCDGCRKVLMDLHGAFSMAHANAEDDFMEGKDVVGRILAHKLPTLATYAELFTVPYNIEMGRCPPIPVEDYEKLLNWLDSVWCGIGFDNDNLTKGR